MRSRGETVGSGRWQSGTWHVVSDQWPVVSAFPYSTHCVDCVVLITWMLLVLVYLLYPLHLLYLLQIGPDHGDTWMLLVLLAQILEQPFYEELRTKQQLGWGPVEGSSE